MNALPERAHVVPSLLAADAGALREQVLEVVDAGARMIHVDVMDAHFVATFGFTPSTVATVREAVEGRGVLLDVHLMVESPDRHVASFARAGADIVTVHIESRSDIRYALDAIHDAGCYTGVALRPSTPPVVVRGIADDVDVALCMTINPGWGGQQFLPTSPSRIAALREQLHADTPIEVDGGINSATAQLCVEAGARLLVAGSAIFGADDPGSAYLELAATARRLGEPNWELV
jgi:ribulose-phosphate 3-epimerase